MPAPGRPQDDSRPKLVRELWSGPLGSVWLARVRRGPGVEQPGLVRRISGLDERLTRVQQAAEIAKLLSHRSLLKVLGSERSTDGSLSVISQNLECISLRALARTASERGELLPAPVAARIVLDALQAACALHKQLGTIRFERTGYERSLFADTILVAQSGETLLMDPVVSGQLASLLLARGERELVVYRAPEEIGSPAPAPSERAEVWTAGLVLWELLAGRRVCDSSRSDEALAALRAGRVPPLEQSRSGFSPSLARLIERAMSPRPEKRPATLAEFARALQAFGPNVVASTKAVQQAVAPYLDSAQQIPVGVEEISEIVDSPVSSGRKGAPPSSQDWEPPTLVRESSAVSRVPPPAAIEPMPRFPDTAAGSVAALPPRSPVRHPGPILIGIAAVALALTAWLLLRKPSDGATSPPPAAASTIVALPAAVKTPTAAEQSDEPAESPRSPASVRPRTKPAPRAPEPFHPKGI